MNVFDNFMDFLAMNVVIRWCIRGALAFALAAAFVASVGIAWAKHDEPNPYIIEARYACHNPEAARAIIETADATERREITAGLMSFAICFDLGDWYPAYVHEVAGRAIWMGDDLGDEMVIVEIVNRYGEHAFGWFVSKAYPWLNTLPLPGTPI